MELGAMSELLDATTIRALANKIDLKPTKQLGQNFVTDGNTVRRIVSLANVQPADVVVEVGPGLGSLTLGLLATGAEVIAIEIDPKLAELLPSTVEDHQPAALKRLTIINSDALDVTDLPQAPTKVVANLPYNVSVPVILHLLELFPSWEVGLVMVQLEVADRLVAKPGSKVYGVPSAKLAWYAGAARVGTVPPSVFWPVPNVDSGLVRITRRETPKADRQSTFEVIDAAFSQRRKMLRSALSGRFSSSAAASNALESVGIDPTLRGEMLGIEDFIKIATANLDKETNRGSDA